MITSIRNFRLSQLVIAAVALPLAAGPLSGQQNMISIKLCSADGQVRSVNIPVDQEDGEDHCIKPCHACLSRKKNAKN
ncbi:hypothetical protein [Parasphingorhabdus sp.]|uniref:hypothetical protein n=1 Tax=Parasphingorhabdus sp. TaxID=2709688 RepID=UPI003A943FBB